MSDPRYAGERDNFGDTTYVDALVIAAIVMAALIALVILRFFVNFLIELFILGDYDSTRRTFGGLFRILCPWFHPRTRPEEATDGRNQEDDLEIGNLFRRRPEKERTAIIERILPTKILSSRDIGSIKLPEANKQAEASSSATTEDRSEGGACVCSICLVDFEIGDEVVTSDHCTHFHHKHCIVQWLGSHGMDCPYCRRQMVSMESIRTASFSSDSGTE